MEPTVQWYAEISAFKAVPFILVGTKADARQPSNPDHVLAADGEKLAKELGAKYFAECSAKDLKIQHIFQEAARVALAARKGLEAAAGATLRHDWQHGVCSCCNDATQCLSFMFCGSCIMATAFTQYQRDDKIVVIKEPSFTSNLVPLLIPLYNMGYALYWRRKYAPLLALGPRSPFRFPGNRPAG
jgi:hypothetical protein